jgi:transcriptional regulator of acetoin/glycerol metabolism
MVILTDASGVILHTQGNPQFINKAQRVALRPGVSWSEESTGTNAIGTALVEQSPVMVMGAEHYFRQNAFLNCTATPILDPYGQTIGVLDISGDHRQPQEHTLALVQMSAQMIENRLFSAEFSRDITLHFHARAEFLGTLWEGIAVFSHAGRLLAVNKSGQLQLGLQNAVVGTEFSALFDGSLESVLDLARYGANSAPLILRNGHRVFARIEPGRVAQSSPAVSVPAPQATVTAGSGNFQQLEALDTGDGQMHKAICALKRVLGRDIPILIEGETGTGKELMAKAIHAASPRGKGPFVAINCASIPEGLIEAELFGYVDGAFTGARRSGVQGKILQANGGTLFLDEIGDMPHALQARLLRVLQERELVPLGSAKSVPVDIVVISATNRKLRLQVEQGRFRDDLYYRLNGLRIGLPPLRERQDLLALAERILREEAELPARLHAETVSIFLRHPWHGNVRQLRNVLRTALAFLDEGSLVFPRHLPEDFLEEYRRALSTEEKPAVAIPGNTASAEIVQIRQALDTHTGNVANAAAHLGISRATLYRKMKRLGIPAMQQ